MVFHLFVRDLFRFQCCCAFKVQRGVTNNWTLTDLILNALKTEGALHPFILNEVNILIDLDCFLLLLILITCWSLFKGGVLCAVWLFVHDCLASDCTWVHWDCYWLYFEWLLFWLTLLNLTLLRLQWSQPTKWVSMPLNLDKVIFRLLKNRIEESFVFLDDWIDLLLLGLCIFFGFFFTFCVWTSTWLGARTDTVF